MTTAQKNTPSARAEAFVNEGRKAQPSFLAEFWQFLRTNKKWWLTPIVAVLLMMGALLILGGSGAAPFIYTLF